MLVPGASAARARRTLGMLIVALLMFCTFEQRAAAAPSCEDGASDDCFHAFQPGGSKLELHYYASQAPAAASRPSTVLIVMHGHPRDANRTFDAGLQAARASSKLPDTLIVAPLFQVAGAAARRCSSQGVPDAVPEDLVWTCQSWMQGAAAENDKAVTSFTAIDALIGELVRLYPSIHSVTFAGFSAGAQMVQHYIAFRGPAPANVSLRFVVSDPGTWLYFDPVRPSSEPTSDCTTVSNCDPSFAVPAGSASCASYDQWKYGIANLPGDLAAPKGSLRSRYADADIHYLEGELDFGEGKSKAYRVLDRSCGADLQGPFRLQRGLAYAAYDRKVLLPNRVHPIAVVPSCAHEVACVFPSPIGRAALFGE